MSDERYWIVGIAVGIFGIVELVHVPIFILAVPSPDWVVIGFFVFMGVGHLWLSQKWLVRSGSLRKNPNENVSRESTGGDVDE